MKTLRLSKGDPVRITGTELPKDGSSSPKHNMFTSSKYPTLKPCKDASIFCTVCLNKGNLGLEQALRNFTVLTQGDIIEISYNSIIFGLLVMETTPGGESISILDTDLEIDFTPPVGYVEPERRKATPQPTMASKLSIDLSSQTPGPSRPGSSMGGKTC